MKSIDKTENEKQKIFIIPVFHNRIKNNQVTALHLMIAVILIVFGFVIWTMPPEIKWIKREYLSFCGLVYTTIGLMLLLISFFFNKRIIQSSKNIALRLFEIIILISIITFSVTQKWYIPLAYSSAAFIAITFAYFWEKSANQHFQIKLTPEGIILPRFMVNKNLLWQNIKNIIFKHDLITIDCRDNKIFQFQIKSNTFHTSDQALYYSIAKIKASETLYQKEW